MLARVLVRRLTAEASRSTARDAGLPTRLLHHNGVSPVNPSVLGHLGRVATISVSRSFATGTTATKTTAPTKKKTTTKKTTAKKTTAKKPAKKAAKKPAKKAKKKPAAKKKAAAKKPKKAKKSAPKKRKVLTEKQKQAAALRKTITEKKQLREKALLKGPEQKAQNVWTVYVTENQKGTTGVATANIQAAAQRFHNLSAAEREHYNHVANQQKASNEAAMKRWVEQYTPLQIHEANVARRRLNRLAAERRKAGTAGTRRIKRLPLLHDARAVSAPKSTFRMFVTDRHATGDFRGVPLRDATGRIAEEYRALSEAEKKKYTDVVAQDRGRYMREYKQTYGKASEVEKRQKSS